MAIFKIIFLSLYAPITSDDWHARFPLNAASQATRNTEQMRRGEVNCLFNATINDISIMYVMALKMCRQDWRRKLYLRSDSQCHRHFVGFFNMPVQAPIRDQPFIRLFREIAPFSRLLRYAEDTEDFSHLKPPASPTGAKKNRYKYLVLGSIRIPNTARPPAYKSPVITTRPQLGWY